LYIRLLCLSNTVEKTVAENEIVLGGRGGALYNGDAPYNDIRGTTDSTVLFKRKAIFKDNVGALVRR